MADESNRELRVEELDLEDMVQNLHVRVGEAWALAWKTEREGSGGEVNLSGRLLSAIPFIKALAQLAREHPERARRLWAEALREPMPLGQPAIGMPRVANPPAPAPLDPPMTERERDWAQRHGGYQAPETLTPRGLAVVEAWRREGHRG